MTISFYKKQRGIAPLAILVVILTVVIIGGVGYYIANRKDSTKPAASSPTPTTQPQAPEVEPSPPTATSSTDIFKIKELGVQFAIPKSLADLTYHTEQTKLPKSQTGTVAYFSTKKLAQADPKCSDADGGVAAIMKVAGQYPTDDEYAAGNYGRLVKQFSSFYISYDKSSAACSNKPDVEQLRTTATASLLDAIKAVEEIK